jgi:membrane-bound ClpP family serine protease
VGDRALIGELASVREALDPNGMVFAFGEHWSASLDPGSGVGFVPVGATVVVMSVEGLRLLVRSATAQEQIRGASIVVTPEPDEERGAPESTAPAGV